MTVVAIVANCMEPPTNRRATAVRLVVAWGSTAFGGVHQAFDYSAMVMFSAANWDVPPGTGYLTVAVLGLSGLLTLAYGLRQPGSAQRLRTAGSALVHHPA